jgi:predicted nuclease with TOPRIM domain
MEKVKQMEELQLIINQLEEKNSQLEKINQKLLLDTTELKKDNEYLHMKCDVMESELNKLPLAEEILDYIEHLAEKQGYIVADFDEDEGSFCDVLKKYLQGKPVKED